MSHYDCKNCGEPMGVAYGSCPNCTPKAVFEAGKALTAKRKEAEQIWESMRDDERKEFINSYCETAKFTYDAVYKAGIEQWRKQHES